MIEKLVRFENLRTSSCKNFRIEGEYRKDFGLDLYVMTYEIAYNFEKKQWDIVNMWNNFYLKEGEYEKRKDFIEQKIREHLTPRLEEIEALIQPFKQFNFQKEYEISFHDVKEKCVYMSYKGNGEYIDDGEKGVVIMLNEHNDVVYVELSPAPTERRDKEIIVKDICMEWFDHLKEFHTFLLTESKDRVRLITN